MKKVYKWIREVIGRKIKNIWILSVLQIMIGLSSVILALVLRRLIDMAVQKNMQGFKNYAGITVIIILLQIVVRALIRYLEEYSRAEIENCFKHRLFRTLLSGDYAEVTGIHSEEWMNRLTSDTVIMADGLVQIFPGFVCMFVKMTAGFVAVCTLEYRLAYLLIPGGILLLCITYGFRKVLKSLHRSIQETDGKLRIFMQEHLGSLIIIKAFAKEQRVLQTAEEKMQQHKTARMLRNHISNLCNMGFAAAMNGLYLLGVFVCGYGILKGTMSYGTFVAITQLIGQIQSPLANITGYFPQYYAMLASGERLQEAENIRKDDAKKISLEKITTFYKEKFVGIEFCEASFEYPALDERHHLEVVEGETFRKNLIFKNINLKICKGEYIAFTGTSGCGKSTLLKLFMCLYPLNSGERRLLQTDEAVPFTSSWRQLYAYVPQGNYLMSGTIREVIALGDEKAMMDEERIHWALKIACAEEFVMELECGIDAMLGERGSGLSEGQMQRIAIARAIFSYHPILLLDEATSSLDEETEKNVLKNLKKMTDKTVMIVTHRKAVLDICDRHIDLKNGINEIFNHN